jgi:hypothetical protein
MHRIIKQAIVFVPVFVYALFFISAILSNQAISPDEKFKLLAILILLVFSIFAMMRILLISNSKALILLLLLLLLCSQISIVFTNLEYGEAYYENNYHIDTYSIYKNTVGIESFYEPAFSNDAFFVILIKILYIITGSSIGNYWAIMSLFNILFIDIGIIFMYKIAKELYGTKVAILASLLLVPILLNYFIYYSIHTDTFSIPFITGSVYFFVRAVKSNNSQKRILWSGATGIVLALGWLIRPLIVTVIVSLVIALGAALCRNKKLVLSSAASTLVGLFFLCGIIGGFYTIVLPNQNIFPYNKNINVPMTYMLAQNIGGINWSGYEVLGYIKDSTTAEQKQKNIVFIKSKLKEYGFVGYVKQIKCKFFEFSTGGNFVPEFARKDFFENGLLTDFTYNLFDAAWFIILFGIIFGMYSLTRPMRPFDFNCFIRLLPIGLLLLSLFFTETWSRYHIGHLAIYCIISAHGYIWLFEKIKQWGKNYVAA